VYWVERTCSSHSIKRMPLCVLVMSTQQYRALLPQCSAGSWGQCKAARSWGQCKAARLRYNCRSLFRLAQCRGRNSEVLMSSAGTSHSPDSAIVGARHPQSLGAILATHTSFLCRCPKQVLSDVVQRHKAGIGYDARFSAPIMIGRLKLFSCPSTSPAIFV
jgi:hypothetical protein